MVFCLKSKIPVRLNLTGEGLSLPEEVIPEGKFSDVTNYSPFMLNKTINEEIDKVQEMLAFILREGFQIEIIRHKSTYFCVLDQVNAINDCVKMVSKKGHYDTGNKTVHFIRNDHHFFNLLSYIKTCIQDPFALSC